ncbi:MAG: class I SAM-dependent methyltransferase [Methanomicrobiales archaeon]|nr:class I SAM-dependent methyltransferase [Methanomicrobiales archaeon]MDD1662735.1 class I SAM-dependent methyltransferase [Methanomicrobiales archaeon]
MAAGTIYENGAYARAFPAWHREDSSWKAARILEILEKNGLQPGTICEVGCGAGGILMSLRDAMDERTRFYGYEISPQAFSLCQEHKGERLEFVLGDFLREEGRFFDLILAIDLIEHLEDYHHFLREIRTRSTYKIFHIPLEIFALAAMSRSFLPGQRDRSGHLHFFTKDIVLRMLHDLGYEVMDFRYTPGFLVGNKKTWKDRVLSVPRRFLFPLGQDATVRFFGGYSLLVLAR